MSTQFQTVSLAEHLSNGKPWELDRTVGGLMVLQPHCGTERQGWHAATRDALWRAAPLIRQHGPDAAGAERRRDAHEAWRRWTTAVGDATLSAPAFLWPGPLSETHESVAMWRGFAVYMRAVAR